MKIWLLALLLLCSCSPMNVTIQVHHENDDDPLRWLELYTKTVRQWDKEVGWRLPYSASFHNATPPKAPQGNFVCGRATCVGDFREITIWSHPDMSEDNYVNTVLHELGHIHLTCSENDHRPGNRESVMHPTITGVTSVDDETMMLLQQNRAGHMMSTGRGTK